MLEKSKHNGRLSKEEQFWRVIFPPKIGDFVEFNTQYEHKHRRMKGYVESIVTNKNGIKCYGIRVTYCEPLPRWGKPTRVSIRGNQKIKIVESEWLSKDEVEKDKPKK